VTGTWRGGKKTLAKRRGGIKRGKKNREKPRSPLNGGRRGGYIGSCYGIQKKKLKGVSRVDSQLNEGEEK